MIIDRRPPEDRGVTTLMYVGDDNAVDKATATPDSQELAIGAIAALVALQSKGLTRLAAAGVASYVGYRLYQARK
jgi:hypothetical protein